MAKLLTSRDIRASGEGFYCRLFHLYARTVRNQARLHITRMGLCSMAEIFSPFIFFCFMDVLISLFCSDLFCMGECRFVFILVVYLNYFISV